MKSSPAVRPRIAAVLASGAAAALLLAACGSSSGYGGSGSGQAAGAQAAASGVAVEQTAYGPALADSSGRTLYVLTADTNGRSTCSGACIAAWPAVAATTSHGSGVTAALGSLTRGDGTKQLTVAGLPVYAYAGDAAANDTNGQGISSYGGTWWVIGPTGAPITSTAGATSAPAVEGGY